MNEMPATIEQNVSLAGFTSFRIGGCARYFAQPSGKNEIFELLKWSKSNNIPYYVIGSGSNLLVSDSGYEGLIICLDSRYNHFEIQNDNILYAEAGAMLTRISSHTCKLGYTDMLFACGIPGTIGGGLIMNAGINTGELKGVVIDMQVLDKELNEITITNEQAGFTYRDSKLKGYFILSARCALKNKEEPEAVLAKRRDLLEKRKKTQPNNYPNAGSVFKNPPGDYAGRLIEAVGLKGEQIGGAQISGLHANFIINKIGGARANDVYQLIKLAQDKVKEKFDIELQLEVKLLGKF